MEGVGHGDPSKGHIDASAGIGGLEFLQPFLAKHVAEFEGAKHRCVAPLGDGQRVTDVILMAMGEGDMGAGERLSGDPRRLGLGISRDEGVDEDGVRPITQAERGMSVKGDLDAHGSLRPSGERVRDKDRDNHSTCGEHPGAVAVGQPGILKFADRRDRLS